MGEIKEVLQNVKKKKWGKEEWIILILVGVFFMVVFWPDSKQEKAENENIDNIDMSILSMGMSDDYVQAILEGATMIRVGTALFGKRVY